MSFLDKFSLKGSSKVGTDTYQPVDPALPEYSGLISNGQGAPPPSYDQHAQNAPAFPEADQCLAHLKLLSSFHALKEDVGYTDGIFGLYDAKCEMATNRDASLAKMREKRWALYVARAAERFQDWWLHVLCHMEPSSRLEGKDIASGAAHYTEFTNDGRARQWTPEMLPPLGKDLPVEVNMSEANFRRCSHGLALLHAQSTVLP